MLLRSAGTETQDKRRITFGSLNRATAVRKQKEKAMVEPEQHSYTEDMGESSMWMVDGSSTLDRKIGSSTLDRKILI